MKIMNIKDAGNGSAFDRGAADSYYWRIRRPHYFKAGSYTSEEVTEEHMTAEQIEAYHLGYDWNEELGDKKLWE